ncbi:MAG: gamma-glutamyltransferase [Ignavibacteriales bacterium]|nr:MAG: gamma-glutamyltransferase [Ignavibacteriales bacterium]
MLMRTSIYSKIVFSILIIFISFTISNAQVISPVTSEKGMVVSASSLASDAGLLMLKRGGNAIDAAIATGFALAVTYPQAGNIGGGGYMVIHLANGKDIAIDFREKAPIKSFRDMFLDKNGNFNPELSQDGITSVGVPGSVAGLVYVLNKYGTMKLEEVIQPAISFASDGFPLSSNLAHLLNDYSGDFRKFNSNKTAYAKVSGNFTEGEIFKQPELAKTLSIIREKGTDGFYKGEIADQIIKQSDKLKGYLTHKDLEDYKVIEKEPVKGSYHDYKIISMPPSSSGGIIIIQTLNVLENFKFNKEDWNSSGYIHKLTETFKYVYADRSKHLGDEEFYNIPKDWLISKDYAKQIFNKIGETDIPSKEIFPGEPAAKESDQTTHYSVYDQFGNAVSVTTTLNSNFGSRVVVDGAGFILNNEMDDFSSKPGTPNQFGLVGSEANSIAPGKRMLSSMAPTIVLKDDKPVMVVGTPGGSTIPTVILQVIMNCIEFGMNIEQAVAAPRIHHQWLPDELYYEDYGLSEDVINNLKLMKHKVGHKRILGLVEAIWIDHDKKLIFGSSDPRGSGKAAGF